MTSTIADTTGMPAGDYPWWGVLPPYPYPPIVNQPAVGVHWHLMWPDWRIDELEKRVVRLERENRRLRRRSRYGLRGRK